MSADAKATLVFVPFPIIGHLVSAVATAKLLVVRDERLAVTILIIKLPTDTKVGSYTKTAPHPRINFVHLPENNSSDDELSGAKNPIRRLMKSNKGPAREAVAKMMESGKVAGFVLDALCSPMVDVANELGAPAYIYFPFGSSFLGLLLHLHDDSDTMEEYEDSDAEIPTPTYVNPVPAKVWPAKIFDRENGLLDFVARYRECRGIVINTFLEFEPHAISSLSADEKLPPVYPIGPVVQGGEERDESKQKHGEMEIIGWLDEQPGSSVVFLCFGSNGSFESDQVKEIATALEQSGLRFLWSLRKPPPKGTLELPGEYEDPEQVLPEGFVERTKGVGKVIGWAPQMDALSHPAVGGFVSHCGWNSILESVWCGVPIAAWPLAAEQQANAFLLVKEFEMAVEIKIDYRISNDVIVAAETIEKAIRKLMEPENTIRVKVKELQGKSRVALVQGGGSSYNFLGRLIDDVMGSIS